MLKSYVKAGADIDGKTNSKETALHKCGRWDRKEAALYLLSLGANPSFKNGDGNKASDMTADPEMKFLLDNYEEYLILQKERRAEEREAAAKERGSRSPTGSSLSPQRKKLYGVTDNGLSISIDDIIHATPKSFKSKSSPSKSPKSPRSVAKM
jgi:hypothetical protein